MKSAIGIVFMIFCLLMTSGQMWNKIVGIRFPKSNVPIQSKRIQFLPESLYSFAINAALALAFHLMVTVGEWKSRHTSIKKILVILGVLSFSALLSSLLYLVQRRQPYYPYNFLIKY